MKRLCSLACFCLTFAVTDPPSAAAADKLQPLDVRAVKVGGEIGRRIEVTITNNLLVLDMEKDFLAPFKAEPAKRTGAYIGLGKLIDAAVRFAAHTGDERVKTLKCRLVREAISAQEADGYIGTFQPAKRMWPLWDIHEMNYLAYGLAMDHRFFGEKASLEAARKLADYIVRRWAAEPPKLPTPWDITLHMGVTGLENTMLALHRETGDARYLDFVMKTRQLAAWDAHVVTGRWGLIEGHAYAHLCRCIAQLRLHRLQPNARLLKPTRDVLDFILRGEGMTITGEVGDHECWHDTQEGTINLGESCASAYLVRWLDELLRMEGKPLYGDLMERVIFNGLFAGQSPDGRRIRYYTPMDGPRDYHKGDTYCCPNNYRRTIAELPACICYRDNNGIAVNLYAQSEAKVELSPQLCVKVRQETDYPNSGCVTIRLEPSQPAQFPLHLRIPRWCREPKVSVNGEAVAKAAKPGEFFTINRKWRSGDRVELDLPMPLRLVAGRVAQAGRVAIMRGPQVFCLNRSRYPKLANTDLRLLVIDPKSVEGPFKDDSVRPGGVACRVKAWGAGAWYPHGKPNLTLELSEFADPAGEFTFFKVPNPNAEEIEDDELLAQE
ncbi:MAG: glycoside hydrolase family 127 protein [Verrucomicrobia bacterium]|nr:glycoside hydrolase family 127 protein [Verrucomicrobiota bacterium]